MPIFSFIEPTTANKLVSMQFFVIKGNCTSLFNPKNLILDKKIELRGNDMNKMLRAKEVTCEASDTNCFYVTYNTSERCNEFKAVFAETEDLAAKLVMNKFANVTSVISVKSLGAIT